MKHFKLIISLSVFCFFANYVYGQEVPEDKWFRIQSTQEAGKSNGGYWDIKGHPKGVKEGERQGIQVYTIDNDNDRLYRFEEVDENEYIIIPKHDEDCSVQIEESQKRDGVNIFVGETDSETNNGIFKLVHKGNGNWKILTLDGRGICLAGRSSANSNIVHLWTDHQGPWTEWQLVDAATGRCYIPEVEKEDNAEQEENEQNAIVAKGGLPADLESVSAGNLTGSGAESFVKSLNESYKEVLSIERRIGTLNSKVNTARKVIEKTSIVSGKLNSLNSSIQRLSETLLVFSKIPVVGPPVTTLNISLGQVKTRVDGVNDKVQSFEKPVIRPAFESISQVCDVTQKLDDYLVALNTRIISIKQQYAASSTCLVNLKNQELTNKFEKSSYELSSSLSTITRELSQLNKDITRIENICEGISKLAQPVKLIDRGISGVNKILGKTDKVTKKVSSVLNKRFKKKIMGKKINISVKDIITGGKVGKTFQAAAEKWANKALKPVLKQLKIKIPEIPGADDLVRNIEAFKSFSKDLINFHKVFSEYQAKTLSLQENFNQKIDICLKDVPCK